MAIGSIDSEAALREFIRREIGAQPVLTQQLQGRFPVGSADIADAAVTLAKLAPGVVYGRVNGTGTVADAGSGGWSVSRTSVGLYVLTFTPAFASTGYVLHLTGANTNATYVTKEAGTTTRTASQASVWTFNSTTGALLDGNFDFLVIGPR